MRLKKERSLLKLDGTKEANLHFKWSPSIKPAIKIEQNEEIEIIVPDSSTMQIKEDWKTEDLEKLDNNKLDGAVGPIFINGAEPGDLLQIEMIGIKPGRWGWSAILSDFGLLKGEFAERLVMWDIKDGFAVSRDEFLEGVRIPVRPFLGIVGTAPKSNEYGMIPPQYFGGNMDNRLLTEGSTIFLPVNQKGGMLSVSDPHASQGDGEVCGTAIETSATVKLKAKVEKGSSILFPRAVARYNENGERIVAMGISEDLHDASAKAVKNMISELENHGLTSEESYMLMSVAGDLRISEIVDVPHFVVSATIDMELIRNR